MVTYIRGEKINQEKHFNLSEEYIQVLCKSVQHASPICSLQVKLSHCFVTNRSKKY